MLVVKNIETLYGLVMALRGVSLELIEGKITAILGSNGAGKSTLCKTVMGMLEDQPDKGTIWLDDKRIDKKDTEDIVNLGLAYVPEGREVFEELTVLENLQMGAYTRKGSEGRAELKRVYELFPRLAERAKQLAGHLSGGEQQMLAIGRALMMKPRIMLLDEPSLGLSPLLVKEIFATIQRVNQEDGTTILLVEQNAAMALKVCHHGYVMENGRFVLAGTPEELMADEDVREFYLGIRSEVSVKGYQRYKRKKRWR
ncbi:MAG: ABC transporter ATP-binding protein [Desulfarculaceae bacterium]|nr:ABC transporter ATP-binding protein [Desulfarculaceae bacterium]MCF8073038.1 ABC transporter ATP-binding protein [Desulfarculaceae bacterium]MCF8101877.1 ABC transporter ATP-binding protein [Desulfarculaceae bacterium]MCF8115404.1 ABC transporter ATP-binding protein [Desulfarculaceae bacterium]